MILWSVRLPLGLDIALDLAGNQSPGIEPGFGSQRMKSSDDVHHLPKKQRLIHSIQRKRWNFFSSQKSFDDSSFALHQPGVVIRRLDGSVDLCLVGRTGTMDTQLSHQRQFLQNALIECLLTKT